MDNGKNQSISRQINKVTYIGMVVNISLAIAKFIVGSLTGSLALVADGVHSLSDLATDAAVLLGVKLGSREADRSHPYGHGRAETFAGLLVAVILISVGGTMIYYATVSIAKDHVIRPNFAILVVAIASVISKEWLYRVTRKIAVQAHSPSVYANAWHHRSDALSSIAVVIGFFALEFGYDHGDQVAANAVGLMIIWVGIKVIGGALMELTEGAIDTATIEQIEKIINADSQIHHWHKLRTRTVGREIFIDVHILVEPSLNVLDAHAISENLEKALDSEISRPVNITIHIEPDIPELRK